MNYDIYPDSYMQCFGGGIHEEIIYKFPITQHYDVD